MIVGTPDPRCINCRPDMPYHWHHNYMRVDVYPPPTESYLRYADPGVSVGELDITAAEAREMAAQLLAAADIAERISKPCRCGHTYNEHGKYFKQTPCNVCDCADGSFLND